mmetsp:Transcript_14996/g.29466  ORF Transcript_14996/g.29466 Transcript_14996/m.29466 type:complete len:233 (-) Transcript_14996:1842-2540(-)
MFLEQLLGSQQQLLLYLFFGLRKPLVLFLALLHCIGCHCGHERVEVGQQPRFERLPLLSELLIPSDLRDFGLLFFPLLRQGSARLIRSAAVCNTLFHPSKLLSYLVQFVGHRFFQLGQVSRFDHVLLQQTKLVQPVFLFSSLGLQVAVHIVLHLQQLLAELDVPGLSCALHLSDVHPEAVQAAAVVVALVLHSQHVDSGRGNLGCVLADTCAQFVHFRLKLLPVSSCCGVVC